LPGQNQGGLNESVNPSLESVIGASLQGVSNDFRVSGKSFIETPVNHLIVSPE
jgi:hypothetical protein